MAGALPHAVHRSLSKGSTDGLVTRAVSPSLPRRELGAVRLALEAVQRGWDTDGFAARAGFSRAHLSVLLRARGLPSAGHLLTWARMLHAGRWLSDPGRTAESVSRQLSYSNGAAFRRALRNYVGATPTEVIADGGVTRVLERFVQACDLHMPPRGPRLGGMKPTHSRRRA
ncbi:MAG: helix-turn-helix domain-containing protein [Thioalkalivibrio sp.]|nr:helix-turn-helix domain-containing protein [Thioalkalivibrio sp.]